jgi:ectoine hydroxylase-related dioxygenase (phytanoyl-CoA dioxygenase family)
VPSQIVDSRLTTVLTAAACLTASERYRFAADGYLVVPNALTSDEVSDVRAQLEPLAARATRYGFDHQTSNLIVAEGTLQAVTNPLASAPVVLDVATHPGFFPKINELLGGATRLLSNEYFITPPASQPRLGWHRDAAEENFPAIELASSTILVNALVLLSDVRTENGPTLAIPGSHRWGRGDPLPEDAIGNPDPRSIDGHTELCGPAGSAVFFNARLFHAQSENRSGVERHVLVFVYGYRWMRAFPGFETSAADAELLGGTAFRDQLLGLGPAFDEPVAAYEPPSGFAPSGC